MIEGGSGQFDKGNEERKDPLQNNLLSEQLVPPEKFRQIAYFPLREVGFANQIIFPLYVRNNIRTLGDLLNLTQEEFGRLQNIGPGRAWQIGLKIHETLELSQTMEELYPRTYIPSQLARASANSRLTKKRERTQDRRQELRNKNI